MLRLKYHNSIADAVADLGRPEEIGQLFAGFQKDLYHIDETSFPTRYDLEPASRETPQQTFERGWALALLDQALTQIEKEFAAAGKAAHFEPVKAFLSTETSDGAYTAVAAKLGMTPGAVSVMVHRLRERYREQVRAEIAHTVADSAEIDEEMRYLFAVLSR